MLDAYAILLCSNYADIIGSTGKHFNTILKQVSFNYPGWVCIYSTYVIHFIPWQQNCVYNATKYHTLMSNITS